MSKLANSDARPTPHAGPPAALMDVGGPRAVLTLTEVKQNAAGTSRVRLGLGPVGGRVRTAVVSPPRRG